jgi:hypothetical protein
MLDKVYYYNINVLIALEVYFFIAEKLHILALNNNHSLTNSNFVVYI